MNRRTKTLAETIARTDQGRGVNAPRNDDAELMAPVELETGQQALPI